MRFSQPPNLIRYKIWRLRESHSNSCAVIVGLRNRQNFLEYKQTDEIEGQCIGRCDEIEGTRVPDTDQFWGLGEVLQLGQTAMRFDRQVDNIIWE